MSALTEFWIILLLILLNGFFAAAEIAILTARRGRLEQAAKSGNSGAQIALTLSSDANRFLSTVQVGISLVGTLAATFGGASLVGSFHKFFSDASLPFIARNSQAISLALVTLLITFISLVFGELVPKRLALLKAESLATFTAYPMYILSLVTKPFVALLGRLTGTIVRLLGGHPEQQPKISIEDIHHLIESGRQEGVVEAHEHKVAMEALRLGDRRVKHIMHHRVDIEALDVDTPQDEILGAVAMSGFSRLPVYEGTLDHILGFIYMKDVFQQYYLGRKLEIRKLLHKPLFVPENLSLDRLLPMFQDQRTQLAIVLDEYGGTEGMVTFEDVLEELVGDIHDEHRRDTEQRVVQRDATSWLVDGGLNVHELVELLQPHLPGLIDSGQSTTISGLILAQLERLPKISESINWKGVRLEVVDMDGNRIDRVLVDLPKPPPSEPSHEK